MAEGASKHKVEIAKLGKAEHAYASSLAPRDYPWSRGRVSARSGSGLMRLWCQFPVRYLRWRSPYRGLRRLGSGGLSS